MVRLVERINFQEAHQDTDEITGTRISVIFDDESGETLYYAGLPTGLAVAEMLRYLANKIEKI